MPLLGSPQSAAPAPSCMQLPLPSLQVTARLRAPSAPMFTAVVPFQPEPSQESRYNRSFLEGCSWLASNHPQALAILTEPACLP